MEISPKYKMTLIKQVESAIWKEYTSYKDVEFYIKKWHLFEDESFGQEYWENFNLKYNNSGKIDLIATLHGMADELLMKVAIDIGVDTPDFIPSIPVFRNELKLTNETALATFERAIKQIETHPDIAISLANSALESVIKGILKDERIKIDSKHNDTLYKLTESILKAYSIFPDAKVPVEIKQIGSGLISASQGIEKLRSEKTHVHGKTSNDTVISDAIYAYFIVNSVTTIGLFLSSFYKQKFPKSSISDSEEDNSLSFL
jgi:hypothetical protein